MRSMQRETFEAILSEAPGVTVSRGDASRGDASRGEKRTAARPASEERLYLVADEHRATLYLAWGDFGTAFQDVVRIGCGHVLRVEQRDRTVAFVEYEAVRAFAVRPPRAPGEAPRTGF